MEKNRVGPTQSLNHSLTHSPSLLDAPGTDIVNRIQLINKV